jgi:hypothetical protein
MRRMLLTLVVALVLVFSTAAPAFAFIHVTVPAGECAESPQAGNNPTAGGAIVGQNPVFDIPVGFAQGAAQSDPDCP